MQLYILEFWDGDTQRTHTSDLLSLEQVRRHIAHLQLAPNWTRIVIPEDLTEDMMDRQNGYKLILADVRNTAESLTVRAIQPNRGK